MAIQGFSPIATPRLNAAATLRSVKAGGGTDASTPATTSTQTAASSNLLAMDHLIGNENDLGALNRWGLASPGMLTFACGGGFRRSIVSMLTGIPTDKLITYGQMGDMMRVSGMDPDTAHLLVEAGIHSPGELSRYHGSDVVTQIQRGILLGAVGAQAISAAANEGRTYSVPSFAQLDTLAANATGLGSSISVPVPTTPAPGTASQPTP